MHVIVRLLSRRHPCTRQARQRYSRASVGLITAKTNVALLAPTARAPQKFWDLAIQYSCVTHSFNYSSAIDDSSYDFVTGKHIDIAYLHPFWSKCYVHVPLELRKGKLGLARAYDGRFVGYAFTSIEIRNYYVVKDHGKGVYGKVRSIKDVIFDDHEAYLEHSENQ